MPSFNPFASVGGRQCSLFEIRLDNDFIVIRGGEDEASGQLLKGVIVLCLREPLNIMDIHLKLTGQCRIAWLDGRNTPSGIHNQKIDRTTCVMRHGWKPFVGDSVHHTTLSPGNYEWPFELMLPGDTAESVEGLYQTGIAYVLKATINRGKLLKNLHAMKRVRIIRTLGPSALELNHAMSVENVWTNKIEYAVVIPQKAVVFGTCIPIEMRFTPLLKGLEMGNIQLKLFEQQEFTVPGQPGFPMRTHKNDREVKTWNLEVSREKHWEEMIEETGQEGWLVNHELPLPKSLNRCIQDCTVQGIKIRHKLKLTVALNNPDGHVSELRATLPVTIFISPNMPIDDEGEIVGTPDGTTSEILEERGNMAPPGYGQHVLDQLYDGVDTSGILTPGVPTPGVQSGINTPFYALSRAGSSENLGSLAQGAAITPAALSSRLQNVSLDDPHNGRFQSPQDPRASASANASVSHTPRDHDHATDSSVPHSPELSRRTSEEDHHSRNHSRSQSVSGTRSGTHSGHATPPVYNASGHATPPVMTDFPSMDELSKVPSYTTATRTPLPRTVSFTGSLGLPDYMTAMSAPNSPAAQVVADPMETITESMTREAVASTTAATADVDRPRSTLSRSHSHLHGFSFLTGHAGGEGERRIWPLQHRGTS
ncbi:arrestin domain-containing protein [Astrocystis sublimbata]|nr:arrestin domain-containing protein [Astrocystis sublimbata]